MDTGDDGRACPSRYGEIKAEVESLRWRAVEIRSARATLRLKIGREDDPAGHDPGANVNEMLGGTGIRGEESGAHTVEASSSSCDLIDCS